MRAPATCSPPAAAGSPICAARTTRWSNIAGDYPAERFNHVHMWQEHPFCALLWYQTASERAVRAGFGRGRGDARRTASVPRGEDRTWPALNRDGMFRTPRAGVEFGDVVLTWYANQGDAAAGRSSRGQLQDHIALSVGDLDAWVAKLRGEGVRFLTQPYGSATRAPS